MKTPAFVMALSLFMSQGAFAMPADPVIDYAALAKLKKQLVFMKKEYDMLNKTYNNAKSHLEEARKLNQFNSGHYQWGLLKNTPADLKNRQWSADRWEDALKRLSGGNASRYNQLVKAYEQNHPALDDARFLKGASSSRLKQYKQNRELTETVSVQTTYAFDDINTHLSTVHSLSQQIEKTENTKSAMDLNARLLAEMLYIQLETLKLQTLISQQTAQMGVNEVTETGESADFNRLPDL